MEIIKEYELSRLDEKACELRFKMTGLSPVLISYRAKPVNTADLPETGDPSMLGAWAMLLGASAMGLKMRRKK